MYNMNDTTDTTDTTNTTIYIIIIIIIIIIICLIIGLIIYYKIRNKKNIPINPNIINIINPTATTSAAATSAAATSAATKSEDKNVKLELCENTNFIPKVFIY